MFHFSSVTNNTTRTMANATPTHVTYRHAIKKEGVCLGALRKFPIIGALWLKVRFVGD